MGVKQQQIGKSWEEEIMDVYFKKGYYKTEEEIKKELKVNPKNIKSKKVNIKNKAVKQDNK